MNDDDKKSPNLTPTQIAWIITGVIVFGILMGIRGEFTRVWVRMVLAMCAAGILIWVLLNARGSK